MRSALRYEWVRLRTLRSTWWLTGLSLLIAGLLGLPVPWGEGRAHRR